MLIKYFKIKLKFSHHDTRYVPSVETKFSSKVERLFPGAERAIFKLLFLDVRYSCTVTQSCCSSNNNVLKIVYFNVERNKLLILS